MSSQDILEKAIQKAIDGGWGFGNYFKNNGKFEWDGDRLVCDADFSEHYKFAIFNQDFCKALWGEAKPTRYDVFPDENGKFNVDRNYGWQHHLMFMVISPDPIKYLGEHLDTQ